MRLAVSAALAASAFTPPSVLANPVDAFGFGGRGPAMAGAQTAATNDGGANYYNPAALALETDLRIDVGYHYVRPMLSMNTGDQGVETSRGLGVALQIPGKILGHHVTIGSVLFLPDERVINGRTLPAEQPRWALYDNRPQRIVAGAHVGFQLLSSLYVGGGVAVMAGTTGDYELNGRLGFPNAEESELRLDVDVDATPVLYPQVGVLWKPQAWLSIGAAYRGQFVLDAVQNIEFRADIGPPGLTPAVEDALIAVDAAALDFFQPAQFAAGFAIQLTPAFLIAGDITFARWSAFRNPTPDLELVVDVGDMFNEFVDIGDLPEIEVIRFHDTVTPRIGMEWEVARSRQMVWKTRGGYSYEPSPAPEQIGESNFVDNDRHTIAIGLGLQVAGATTIAPKPFDIDIFVAGTLLPERSHRKLSSVNSVGDLVTKGVIVGAGVMTSWRF